MSRRTVSDWRRAVWGSHKINDATRVYLLYLAEHMRADDRKVSVPKERVESALRKTKRQIDDRRAKAIAAGFLGRVSPGYRGHTAVYQGLFPSLERVTPTSTHSTTRISTLSPLERVSLDDTPLLERTSPQRVTGRNVGNDEKAERNPIRSEVMVCDCHGVPDCASLNDPRAREESA